MFSYLADNPLAVPAERKELHYFDRNFHLGEAWYRSYFPSRRRLSRLSRADEGEAISFEATPDYLFHPLAPERLRELLPEAKLIVLLRDPIDRAISNYHHNVSHRVESRPLEQALDDRREEGGAEREGLHPDHPDYGRYAYLARGRYAEQLERWFAVIPRDRFLILDSARLFEDTAGTVALAFEFAGLPPRTLPSYRAFGARRYERRPDEIERRLDEHYAPHNERLWELLGERLSWAEPGGR
jgi:Sulfotransferase domain